MGSRVNGGIVTQYLRVCFFDDGHERVALIGHTAEEGSLIRCTGDLAIDYHIPPLLLYE